MNSWIGQLQIKVKQLDILEGNYVPQGWNDAETEQLLVRRGLLNVTSRQSFHPRQDARGATRTESLSTTAAERIIPDLER